MTEVIVGIEQLLALLETEGINYVRTDPGITDPNYGTIETVEAIMTFRKIEQTVGIHCPICGWHQTVPEEEWNFQHLQGHGHTCGSGKCPSHTHLVLDSDKPHIPESDHNDGCLLVLCECGNDTFRIVDKSDYLPEFEAWEGDGTYKICTKCGKVLNCPQTAAEQGHSRNISIESYRALKYPLKNGGVTE